MTDVAGLVIGVVSAWKTCVQVFDIIDSGKKYGMDYELLRVKLEVERIRLLTWGDTVGLSEVEHGRPSPDARLNREDVRGTVLRLLGAIQHIFDHSERLQDSYGLRPTTPSASEQPDDDEESPTQSQLILGSIFKRAYKTLRRSARDRQRGTPLRKKTIWAVHDKKKFQAMVFEIKGFNDNLESLFPDAKIKALESMRAEIDESEDVDALQSLQEATANQHEDISETASVRLEALGTTGTARSRVSEDVRTVTGETNTAPQADADGADADANGGVVEEELDELSKQMQAVDLYVQKKSEGALTLNLIGPHGYSARVTAYVYWDGRKADRSWSYWDDREKGFVKTTHASFSLYRRRKFIKKTRRDEYDQYSDEDYILFDVESDARYENVNPGTVTVEGFGMECWDYEENFGKKRENTIFVSCAKLPGVPAKKLLRRLDELRHGGQKFGWAPKQEEADLKEFFGDMGVTYYNKSARDRNLRVGDFYSLLNRRDIFADFTSKSSIALEWGAPKEEGIGIWNFLWQIILAKELALRLEHYPDASISGFTPRVLASLIVQDLWLRNVEIILTDAKVSLADIKKPETAEERAKAEEFKARGNEAMKNKRYQEAVDLYTEAVKINLSSAVYRANRSAALFSMEKYADASEDAWVATQLDPKYSKAWARLGIAELKLGNGKRALDAYQRAVEVAGKDATSLMKQGLADAKAKLDADLKAIKTEKDEAKQDELRKNYLDEDWDTSGKSTELHSHVHEQQVEGLLLFAERMRWPCINEVRDYAEDVYGNLRGGATIPFHLYDWLFGMTLPGKWMSFKIMAALVLCTPSISSKLGAAHYYECGLSLPKQSYWRVRTVMGRVLGCSPGVISLCGWIGRCPPVEFVPPPTEEAQKEARYVRLKARRVAPIESVADSDDGVVFVGSRHDRYDATRLQPNDEIPAYLAEMKDSSKWVIPEPPIRQVSTCTIQSIRLKKLPLDVNVAVRSANKELSEIEVDNETQYRASIVFNMDNNEDPVTYTLYTNPVFITPPPCHTGPKGLHEVHVRELPRYQRNIWTVERLKDHKPEDFDDDVMVINATGKGAEVLARAWCAERGKNAVIRRIHGPCFVCALRAASSGGLGVGILIWVS